MVQTGKDLYYVSSLKFGFYYPKTLGRGFVNANPCFSEVSGVGGGVLLYKDSA